MKKILDKVPRPPGAIPARAQAWLLVSLTAAIAITLVTFPGQADDPRAAEAPEGGAAAPSASSGVGVTSVESAARRMREEVERDAERRLQRDLGLPAPRPDGLPHPPAPVAPPEAAAHGAGAGYARELTPEEQIEREERLRRYRSLRTPPLVQSDRSDQARGSSPAAPGADPPPREPPDSIPTEAPRDAAVAPPAGMVPEDSGRDSYRVPATGAYVLREGEFLEAVLANRLVGDFAGPVNAVVSADVFDRSRQRVLVPRGTRALGAASRVEEWGQIRLAVVFHRLILPDGAAVSLGKAAGLNQIGETGLRDRVDRHYLSTFAAAGAVGALAGLTQAVSPQEAFSTRLGAARLSTGAGMARSAERVLDRYLNRLPTVTVREGHRIRIYLTEDLALPAYGRDRTQGDKS